jgi:N-acetylglucosamine repressor
VLNGQLFQGDGFGAGEIGHLRVVENGLLCRCGHYGCLETVATSRAVISQAKVLAAANPQSMLNQCPPAALDLVQIQRAYAAHDPLATELVNQAGQALGMVIGYLIGILNSQTILLSGDMTEFGEPWLQVVRQRAYESTLTALATPTKIEFSCLNQNEVLKGASALLLARELGISPMPAGNLRNGGAE